MQATHRPQEQDARHEERRLEALGRYDLLDTPKEETFDRIARITKRILQVPVATLSLLDDHRQWFKSCEGFDGTEVPREHAFCDHTIRRNQPLIVPDLAKDPRFAQNPLVTGEPHVRFYAGIPLQSPDGYNVGTLCALDMQPRTFAPEDIENLSDLARLAMDAFELRLVATKDSLTGAMTRRAFKEQGSRDVALARRLGQDVSCVSLDLDHFKAINDTHGHAVGDLVLAKAVGACLGRLRKTDVLGRLGGEEFSILLPGTSPREALGVAEKLRSAIARLEIDVDGATIPVTASFGVAGLDQGTRDLDALLAHADTALYKAKSSGRNRSSLWPLHDTETCV